MVARRPIYVLEFCLSALGQCFCFACGTSHQNREGLVGILFFNNSGSNVFEKYFRAFSYLQYRDLVI